MKKLHKCIDIFFKKFVRDNGAFIAGGLPASLYFGIPVQKGQDIDIFFHDEDSFKNTLDNVYKNKNNWADRLFNNDIAEQFATKNAITFAFKGHRIQLIRKTFGSFETVLSGFDLNKAQVAMIKDGKKWVLKPMPVALEPLYFTNFEHFSLARLDKYVFRGFKYDKEHILNQLVDMWRKNPIIQTRDYYGYTSNIPIRSAMYFNDFSVDLLCELWPRVKELNEFSMELVNEARPRIANTRILASQYQQAMNYIDSCLVFKIAAYLEGIPYARKNYDYMMKTEYPELLF